MDRSFVFMETLLEVIAIIFYPMTPRNFLMPWLAQAMGIVSQVLGTVFSVMGWLAKVMARDKKATGYIAGSLSGTCSEPLSAFESYHRLFRRAIEIQHIQT